MCKVPLLKQVLWRKFVLQVLLLLACVPSMQLCASSYLTCVWWFKHVVADHRVQYGSDL